MRRRGRRSDELLASAAGAGDASAFAELYERHAAAIYGYCRRVLRSPEEAADATHEAFVNVLERVRDASRPVLSPRAYLFRAAHNACLRIAEGRRRVSRSEPEPTGAVANGDLSEIERIVFTRELQDDVRAANAQLSLRQREVLALREVERLSYDEIAEIMHTTPNAAAQLAWRARANLRHRLRRRAFAAVTLETLECQRALDLFELAEDSALSPDEDAWLAHHFVTCPRCASNREVLAEVGATYRAWVPAGAVPLLTAALLHQAGQVVGAAWGPAGAGAGVSVAGTAAAGSTAGALASAPSALVATAVGLAVAAGGVGGAHGKADSPNRVSALAAVPTPLVSRIVDRAPARVEDRPARLEPTPPRADDAVTPPSAAATLTTEPPPPAPATPDIAPGPPAAAAPALQPTPPPPAPAAPVDPAALSAPAPPPQPATTLPSLAPHPSHRRPPALPPVAPSLAPHPRPPTVPDIAPSLAPHPRPPTVPDIAPSLSPHPPHPPTPSGPHIAPSLSLPTPNPATAPAPTNRPLPPVAAPPAPPTPAPPHHPLPASPTPPSHHQPVPAGVAPVPATPPVPAPPARPSAPPARVPVAPPFAPPDLGELDM